MAAARRLLVAGLSVRAQAEAAHREGFQVVALDVFGDADTRAASRHWAPIGDAAALRIDRARFLAALQAARDEALREGTQCLGCWPGAGFEAQPELLAQAAERMPLLGTPAHALARVNDLACWQAELQALGLPHPALSWRRPEPVSGWLLRAGPGSGGQRLRAARRDDPDPPPPGHAWQRVAPGLPMSLTGLAAGAAGVAVLGFNRQWTAPTTAQPWRFAGVAGPVALPAPWPARLQAMAERLAEAFDLRGLFSLDFLWQGDAVQLLELNARWPASASLYRDGRWVEAHLAACLDGRLPDAPALREARAGALRGLQVLYAPAALQLAPAGLERLAATPQLHDRPAGPLDLPAGAPVCTLSAAATHLAALHHDLDHRAQQLWRELETL